MVCGYGGAFSSRNSSAMNDRCGSASGAMLMAITGLYAAMNVPKIARASATVAAVRAATPTGPRISMP